VAEPLCYRGFGKKPVTDVLTTLQQCFARTFLNFNRENGGFGRAATEVVAERSVRRRKESVQLSNHAIK
jgi:hypothetical protein